MPVFALEAHCPDGAASRNSAAVLRITLNTSRQRRAESGFANPRLARDQNHPPFTGFRLLPLPQ